MCKTPVKANFTKKKKESAVSEENVETYTWEEFTKYYGDFEFDEEEEKLEESVSFLFQ
jgi:hypothetical protein